MAAPTRREWRAGLAARVCAAWCLTWVGCTPRGDPAIGAGGLTERFDGPKLASHWYDSGGGYRIENGRLRAHNAHNKPLWLRRVLPRDVRIELDARSESPSGDIKVEVFGDGSSKAESTSYTATSYVVIFGGWSNSKNVLARLDEHGDDRVEGPARKVEVGRTYHMKIERRGAKLEVWVDGEMLLQRIDPDPLEGPGHDHFAFNDWQAEVFFDNLRIEPL